MNRIDELEYEIKSMAVDKDAFVRWKDNVITQRFFKEIELDLLETRQQAIGLQGLDCQRIALMTVQKEGHCEVLESVLSWNPTKEDSIDE